MLDVLRTFDNPSWLLLGTAPASSLFSSLDSWFESGRFLLWSHLRVPDRRDRPDELGEFWEICLAVLTLDQMLYRFVRRALSLGSLGERRVWMYVYMLLCVVPWLISAHCFTARSVYIVSGVWACLGTNTCTLTPGPAQTQLVINTWPTLPARPGQVTTLPSLPLQASKAPQLPSVLNTPLPAP